WSATEGWSSPETRSSNESGATRSPPTPAPSTSTSANSAPSSATTPPSAPSEAAGTRPTTGRWGPRAGPTRAPVRRRAPGREAPGPVGQWGLGAGGGVGGGVGGWGGAGA